MWCACFALAGRRALLRYVMLALPSYAVVLWLHFNIKLWAPHINPRLYDGAYWATDQAMRPLIDASFAAHHWVASLCPAIDSFYMNGFILLFYFSFAVHTMQSPAVFRHLFRSALFFQGLGALAYLMFPALGPFLYEPGVNAAANSAQRHMLGVHLASVAGGAAWLTAEGPAALFAGLAAMPSLHAGGAALFLWFALRHARLLLGFYLPTFAFILVEAVASRWHYVIDLPVGIALAAVSIWLAGRGVRTSAAAPAVAPTPTWQPSGVAA